MAMANWATMKQKVLGLHMLPWKQSPKKKITCASTREWVNKPWTIQNKNYLAMKQN